MPSALWCKKGLNCCKSDSGVSGMSTTWACWEGLFRWHSAVKLLQNAANMHNHCILADRCKACLVLQLLCGDGTPGPATSSMLMGFWVCSNLATTQQQCVKMFELLHHPAVQKMLNEETAQGLRGARVQLLREVLRAGVNEYYEDAVDGAYGDICVISGKPIRLHHAVHHRDICEYIISGMGFETQEAIFGW
eukprot:GHRR01035804.1.p1 GENE.GHRR01035804.1~~GHRR01035804.1.p1  ORF type:complete len:192 (+),score=15.82 GHRR01035804.1:478-1053(+)